MIREIQPLIEIPKYRASRLGQLKGLGQKISLTTIVIVLAVAFIIPVIWLLLGSVKTNTELFTHPIIIIPDTPSWDNYTRATTQVPYLRYAANSLFLAVIHTFFSVIMSAFVGYGFARLQAPGRRFLFSLMLATVMIPSIVSIIPQYILYSQIGLIGTYWPWILWGLAGSPFHIFLFRQFFAVFPKELEDAAEVDGANRFRIFVQIFLPNSIPVLAATALFSFQWVWGDWFFQTLFLNESNATLAMKMARAYVDARGTPLYTLTLAGTVIYMMPLIIVFFVAQRYLVEGIITTGLKS